MSSLVTSGPTSIFTAALRLKKKAVSSTEMPTSSATSATSTSPLTCTAQFMSAAAALRDTASLPDAVTTMSLMPTTTPASWYGTHTQCDT